MEKLYEITSELHALTEISLVTGGIRSAGLPISMYKPKEKTERSQVCVLAAHPSESVMYLEILKEMAKHGFTTAGVPLGRLMSFEDDLTNLHAAVDFIKNFPGIKKVILLGHSQGGCITSMYQYVAENGIERFRNPDRVIPFPEVGPLTPADGLMLIDANHGCMDFLGVDPALRNWQNGIDRIPELDLWNPDNGFVEDGEHHYSQDFINAFEKAQLKRYKEIYAIAQQQLEDIKKGSGNLIDDGPFYIAGSNQSAYINKLITMDNHLLHHTRTERPLLHNGGEFTHEVIVTQRQCLKPIRSELYAGGRYWTLKRYLELQMKFDEDFHYDATGIWGLDQDFNPHSTRANVKGIHVPLLLEGNQGNHEFVNIDLTWDNAVSEDKTLFFLSGANHGFEVMTNAEKYPGEFGNPSATFADYVAEEWLAKPGRFLEQ